MSIRYLVCLSLKNAYVRTLLQMNVQTVRRRSAMISTVGRTQLMVIYVVHTPSGAVVVNTPPVMYA